jgi:biopolymer transport protein ExbD
LNEKPVNINQLTVEVERRFGKGQPVYLRADKETIWDTAVQVMSELGAAKIAVNVVTQPEDAAEKRQP